MPPVADAHRRPGSTSPSDTRETGTLGQRLNRRQVLQALGLSGVAAAGLGLGSGAARQDLDLTIATPEPAGPPPGAEPGSAYATIAETVDTLPADFAHYVRVTLAIEQAAGDDTLRTDVRAQEAVRRRRGRGR